MLHNELSLAVALFTQARPHHCYANAWHAIVSLPDLFAQESFLVEGWIVVDLPHEVCVIEHGWCVRTQQTQQQVIDPTIIWLILGNDIAVHFFPGYQHTVEAANQLRCEQLPLVRTAGDYGSDGLGHAGYRCAYKDALALAHTLIQESDKQLSIQPCVELEAELEPDHEIASTSSSPRRLTLRAVPASAWARGDPSSTVISIPF